MNLDKLQKKEIEKTEEILELLTPSELVDHWSKAIESDMERPLTMTFDRFDKVTKCKYRGNVAAFVGYGGSRKSLMALQVARVNVVKYHNNSKAIYSNMEMGIYQFMSRLMSQSFEVDIFSAHIWDERERVQAGWDFEKQYEDSFRSKNREKMNEVKKELKERFNGLYGENLVITSQPRMTVEKFDTAIKQQKKKGPVDVIVIDGLSMMDGIGSELEIFTTNSKELKDLAKLHNIFIILICHCSRGAELHTRDVRKYIRGSEKILDNVDSVYQFSQILYRGSTPDKLAYRKDMGWIQLYDKRGTGEIVDVVYDFDKVMLKMIESGAPPEEFEVELKKKKGGFE